MERQGHIFRMALEAYHEGRSGFSISTLHDWSGFRFVKLFVTFNIFFCFFHYHYCVWL